MLYTLADKFLDRAELDEIKEVMRMTRLGQMLMDEGMEKGIELKETDSIKKLMKNMNLTIDQAMNAWKFRQINVKNTARQLLLTING